LSGRRFRYRSRSDQANSEDQARVARPLGTQSADQHPTSVFPGKEDRDRGRTLGRNELDFITHSQQSIVPVRDRSEVIASNLKKPEMIPPSEVRQAIIYFIKEQIGLRREELPVMVSRVFGFKTTSQKVKELVEKTLTSMHEAGDVVSRDDKLFLA
jgi:hypothetical protein